MSSDEKSEKRIKLLEEAFKSIKSDDSLTKIKDEIESQLSKFLEYLEKQYPKQRFFNSIPSRIKSVDSFLEKVKRKDYLQTWSIEEDLEKNKEYIANNLPDLIGFRIMCFFKQDEEKIRKELIEYYKMGEFSSIELNENEGTKQKNGHDIYKISGKYQQKYSFEIQIKSIMHSIWGEVEHKTVYKPTDYDIFRDVKKQYTEEIFNILQASDHQLLQLFNVEYTEEKLIKSLFYLKTKDCVAKENSTSILAEHYEDFFNLFSESDEKKDIKEYVIKKLSGDDYVTKTPPGYETSIPENAIESIKNIFYYYDLEVILIIAKQLYDFTDVEELLAYVIKRFIHSTVGVITENETDFFDQDEEKERTPSVEEIIIYFKGKLSRNKEKEE